MRVPQHPRREIAQDAAKRSCAYGQLPQSLGTRAVLETWHMAMRLGYTYSWACSVSCNMLYMHSMLPLRSQMSRHGHKCPSRAHGHSQPLEVQACLPVQEHAYHLV